MRFSVIAIVLLLWSAHESGTVVTAGIRLENDSRSTLRVFLKGVKDKDYRGPYIVAPGKVVEINVEPGKYYVATQHPDKTFDYLNWQDYSDHKITYRVSLCTSCRYVQPADKALAPPKIFTPSVHYAAGEYKCPICGQMHRRWVPGWKPGDVRDGRVNDQGEILSEHIFDFRLGVSVIDGYNGVMVTQSLEHSPSRNLRLIEGNTAQTYYLVAGKAIITGVNGKPTPNTTEFLKLMAESPRRVELTVSSTGRKITAKYWADLSE